ncbi:hypothetical protein [Alkalithermobacter paradoxus]|uniref:hypothetical protein n=1 Tax=Alkalithermobacter paradoxus TaxID=29349 RepID=UPI0009A554F8
MEIIKKNKMIISIILLVGMLFTTSLYVFNDYNNDNHTCTESCNHSDENLYNSVNNKVDNETALKIMDMYINLDNYEGKMATLQGQLFKTYDEYSIGVIQTLATGEDLAFNIILDPNNPQINEFDVLDWIEVTGKVGVVDEVHGDHTHAVPILYIDTIRKIDN